MARFIVKPPLERYRCMWEYAPQATDELELEKNDIVLLAQKFEDGWGWGVRLREQVLFSNLIRNRAYHYILRHI